MGRKEKAAAKLVRASKNSVEDSLFSVRALVDQREGGGSRPGSGTVSPRPPPRAPPRAGVTKPGVPPKKTMAQMKKGVDVGSLRKLCPDRDSRDRRSIDEIQRDIRMRKAAAAGGSGTSTPRGGDRGAARPGDRDRDRDRDRGRDPRDADRRDSFRDRDRFRDKERDRRRRSPSSEYDSPPRKRRRDSFDEPSRGAVSAMIQEMFGRGRAPRRYDDDSGSDMEAGLSDVEMEEKRALKIARREDELAEKEENARREAKERARRERERGKR